MYVPTVNIMHSAFICRSANLISYFGPCKSHFSLPPNEAVDNSNKNIWIVPGGSSGGSAVAVATKMCDL